MKKSPYELRVEANREADYRRRREQLAIQKQLDLAAVDEIRSSIESLEGFEQSIASLAASLESLSALHDLPHEAHCAFVLGGLKAILLAPVFHLCADRVGEPYLSTQSFYSSEEDADEPQRPLWPSVLSEHELAISLWADRSNVPVTTGQHFAPSIHREVLELLCDAATRNLIRVTTTKDVVHLEGSHFVYAIPEGWSLFGFLRASIAYSMQLYRNDIVYKTMLADVTAELSLSDLYYENLEEKEHDEEMFREYR